MKTMKYLLGLLLCMSIGLTFIACGDDDEANLVGTWSFQDGKNKVTLTLRNDGTGIWSGRFYDEEDEDYEIGRGSLFYEMEGKSRGVIIFSDDPDEIYFEIRNNKMYMYEKYYGERLLWVLTKE